MFFTPAGQEKCGKDTGELLLSLQENSFKQVHISQAQLAVIKKSLSKTLFKKKKKLFRHKK